MTPLGRIVELAAAGQSVAKVRGFLVVQSAGSEVGRVPLDDIGGVIVTARDATLTSQVLAALAERGVPVVLSGADYLPSAVVYPLVGHHAQGQRFRAQIDRTRPLAKQLWSQVVKAKIERQAWALRQIGRQAGALDMLARQVRSGDPANLEAQAARRYWTLLMGRDFQRDQAGGAANGMLNYGYAVIRAAVARAICASGLHPGIGIFHSNRSNPMPLADDLMEPFRPVVDLAVRRLLDAHHGEVDADVKRSLVALLWTDEQSLAGTTPLGTAILRTAGSLAESYLTGKANLQFPVLTEHVDGIGFERVPDHVDDPDV